VNALLKTIEEPLPNTHLILISERPMALAATLRSRCQRLRFAVPSSEEAQAWLREQEPGLPASALAAAQGAPLRALDAHRSGLLQQQAQWRRELVDVAAQKRSPLVAAAAVGRDRDAAGQWLSAFIVLLSDLLRAGLAVDAPSDARALAAKVPATGLQQMLDEAFESMRRLQVNASPQLVIESLMIAWWRWAAMTKPGATAR
jgi:DNA polymerase-3 subunit delta'